MRHTLERLVMVVTVSFLVLSAAQLLGIAQAETTSMVFAGMAALAVGVVLAARYAAVLIRSRENTVGERAREHRQSLVGVPEPQHPDTAGRPRTRAPSQVSAAV